MHLLEPDPVGPPEVAERLDVPVATVYLWRHHGRLPAPRWQISYGPVWDWRDIAYWAHQTGHWPVSYRHLPPPPPGPDELPRLLGTEDFAALLGCSSGAIRGRVMHGHVPPPKWRVASRMLWDIRDIEEWMAAGRPRMGSPKPRRR